MHETRIVENIFKYLKDRQDASRKKIKKVYIAVSEFGGIKEDHLKEHLKQAARGTEWQDLSIEILKAPFGAELEITKIDFQ
jgi:Zn finger protein HypA/HybF involved in hydrogenase expression